MTKKITVYALILSLGFVFGCKKDDGTPPTVFFKAQPTVEENKAKLESTGIELVNVMRDLKDLETINQVSSFISFLSQSAPSNGKKSVVKDNIGVQVLYNLKSLSSNRMSMIDFFSSMKGFNEKSIKADSSSLQFQFDQVKGIYTWNLSTSTWDYVATGNNIVFNFPSTETGTSNNASITITYLGTQVALPFGAGDQYSGDVPSKITMDFKVDGVSSLTYSLNCEYNSDGIPSSVVSLLTVSPFSYEVSANYASTDVGVKYSLKQNSKIILEFVADVTGDFSVSTLENSMITTEDYYIDWVYDYNTGEYYEDTVWYTNTELDPDVAKNVIHNAHTSFQVLDMKLDGTVNATELANALVNISETAENDSIAQIEAIEAINENILLKLINTKTNDLIATLKAYTFEDTYTYTYTDWVWNETTQTYDEIQVTQTETNTKLGFKFLFPDGSSVDADTYFNDGFGGFVDEINNFIAELNTEYGSTITPIDYSGTK